MKACRRLFAWQRCLLGLVTVSTAAVCLSVFAPPQTSQAAQEISQVAQLTPAANAPAKRAPSVFQTWHLVIDPKGTALASYQIELALGALEAIGLEEGDYPVYSQSQSAKAPLWHDPKALKTGRLVLADFATDPNTAWPTRPVRIATLHTFGPADQAPQIKQLIAGDPKAQAFAALLRVEAATTTIAPPNKLAR